jgi:hypothetical protein
MHPLPSRSLFFLVSAGLLFASGPAGARGFGGGHAISAPHAMTARHPAAQSFAEGRGFTLPSSATTQPVAGQQGSGKGSGAGHHPGKPPPGGSTGSSAASSSAGGGIEQSTPTATSSAPPVTANTTRNSALTGGTDPAIGQSSPPVPNVFASGGGTGAVDHSGGSGNTLAACMQLWDTATHMSKPEWRATCVRTLNGIDLPADGGMTVPTSTRAHVRHTRTRAQAQ